jgi:hypothetical protein
MKRFLIFNSVGQNWGVGRGETPADAVRDIDLRIGGVDYAERHDYEEIGQRDPHSGEDVFIAVPLPPRGRVPSGQTWDDVYGKRGCPATWHRVAVSRASKDDGGLVIGI